MENTKNALAPIEFIVSIAGGLMLTILLVAIPATLFGSGSFLGVGDPEVCLSTPMNAVTVFSHGNNDAHVQGLGSGTSAIPGWFNLCQSHASTGQRILSALVRAPSFLYTLGFLMLAWRLIRYVRRHGFFVAPTALKIERMGLYVLFGTLVACGLRTVASLKLLGTLTSDGSGSWDVWTNFFHLSWAILFAGFGLLTVGRVMGQTVPMREEIDATI